MIFLYYIIISEEQFRMTMINQRYETVKLLGEGGFGSVYSVKDTFEHDKLLALKKIKTGIISKKAVNVFKLEFKFLTSLIHPNLVKVHDFDIDKDTDELFFTMEHIKGKSLKPKAKAKPASTSDGYMQPWIQTPTYPHPPTHPKPPGHMLMYLCWHPVPGSGSRWAGRGYTGSLMMTCSRWACPLIISTPGTWVSMAMEAGCSLSR